jgi:rubrerythrin
MCDFLYDVHTGEILAKDLDCSFSEVAASEQVTQVADVFHEVSNIILPN